MKKLVSLLVLASLPAAAIACATGATLSGTTDDVSLNEADAAPDASGSRLPPRRDAASADPDAGDHADGSPLSDAASDTGLDAAVTDSAVAPDSGSASAACGPGFVQIGEYATWYGKVNVHRATGGAWIVDTDCSSGADINTVAYCQKFWPTTTKQAQLAAVTPDNKPFTSGGGVSPACGGVAPYPGQNQFACCAP